MKASAIIHSWKQQLMDRDVDNATGGLDLTSIEGKKSFTKLWTAGQGVNICPVLNWLLWMRFSNSCCNGFNKTAEKVVTYVDYQLPWDSETSPFRDLIILICRNVAELPKKINVARNKPMICLRLGFTSRDNCSSDGFRKYRQNVWIPNSQDEDDIDTPPFFKNRYKMNVKRKHRTCFSRMQAKRSA